VKDELYESFVSDAKAEFKSKYGHEPKVYDVVISDGARKL
jgi:galactokinase